MSAWGRAFALSVYSSQVHLSFYIDSYTPAWIKNQFLLVECWLLLNNLYRDKYDTAMKSFERKWPYHWYKLINLLNIIYTAVVYCVWNEPLYLDVFLTYSTSLVVYIYIFL